MKACLSLLASFAFAILAGCSQNPVHPNDVNLTGDVNVAHVTAKAVERLVGNLREPLGTRKPILVTTVANIDQLGSSSTLGRLISEQVAASLGQDGYNVTEIRLRGSVLVDPQGEFMLSRDASKLAPYNGAQAIVTGTYAIGQLYVNVILKVVRLDDRKVIGTVSYSFLNGPNTQSLEYGTDSDEKTIVVGM